MRSKLLTLRWSSMWLFAFIFVAIVMIADSVTDAAKGQEVTPTDTCAERSSTYQNSILIYQCEIVDRDGIFVVVESNQSGVVTERPATQAEIDAYLSVNAERTCLADQRAARIALETPEPRIDLESLAARLLVIENAIRECIG